MPSTLTQAVRAFIIADATLAAKVHTAVYPASLPQSPPDNAAVIKIVSNPSFKTLLGATDQTNVRIEVTFWCKLYDDSEILANRLRTIAAPVTNSAWSGVSISVFQTYGPRTVYNPETRYFGSQLDIMATVDMSTAA